MIENGNGKIVVFTGPMLSGKTNMTTEILERAGFARQEFRFFRASVDTRHEGSDSVSHSGRRIKATVIDSTLPPKLRVKIKADLEENGIKIVAFDETQFFSDEIIDFTRELACLGIKVIVAGLDMDSNGKPFGPMPSILAIAEEVSKLKAVCEVCGKDASFTLWRGEEQKKQIIVIGGVEEYAPACRLCWLNAYKATLVSFP